MTRKYNCVRCGITVNPQGEPVEAVANYVRGEDMCETREKRRTVAMIDETGEYETVVEDIVEELNRLEHRGPALNAERVSQSIASGQTDRLPAQVDDLIEEAKGHLDEYPVDSPEEVKRMPDAVGRRTKTTTVECQKTGIVCPDCITDDDKILWGVDEQDAGE